MSEERTVSDVVAGRIRKLCTARGMTVADLAARCAAAGMPKLTAQALYKLLGQRDVPDRPPRPVSVDELLILARALDVTPANLCPDLAASAGHDLAAEAARIIDSAISQLEDLKSWYTPATPASPARS